MENNVVDEKKELCDEVLPEEENKPLIEDSDNPLNDYNRKQIEFMLKEAGNQVKVMQDLMQNYMQEFKFGENEMKEIHQWNEQHRTPIPDNLTEEEKQTWDRYDGLNSITEEKVVEIFGEDSPIIGVEHSVTIDRLKYVFNDFIYWLSVLRDYSNIHDAYLKLMEFEEDKNVEMMREVAEKETDPEKKAAIIAQVEKYYAWKYLDFLQEPLDEIQIKRLVNAYTDAKKIEYWMQRTRDKLTQIKVSHKIILEISQFEKRFLEEKYQKCNQMLLLYFIQSVAYCDMCNHKNPEQGKVMLLIFGLDNTIRKLWEPDKRERVCNNIRALLDQFIDKLPTTVTDQELIKMGE